MSGQRVQTTTSRHPRPARRPAGPALRTPALSRVQALAGNQATHRLAQAKLRLSRPDDRSEREAERLADRAAGGAELASLGRQGAPARPLPAGNLLAPLGSGQRLDPSSRADFEPFFGHDLSRVRVHTGEGAARSARALQAQAFTVGDEIVFGAGEYRPHAAAGKRLLAHELTHVAQQRATGTRLVQRRVTDRYSTIVDRLSYGIIDWAITDREAREVLGILNGLSERDLADTVVALERDGYLERLLDNVSRRDRDRYAVLVGRIHRYRPTHGTLERIADRLTYGVFDWAITERDAHDVLRTLSGLGFQQLRSIVARMVNEGYFDRLMDNLSAEDHRRFRAFIERLRRIRDEFRSLVTAHVAFLRRPPDPADPAQPSGAGQRIRTTVRTTGYGGQTPTFSSLPEDQQRDWRGRAAAVFRELRTSVQGTELEDILRRSRLRFDPEGAERLGTRPGSEAYAFVRGTNVLHVGRSWVRDAEENIRNVWQSIAHELGGHEEFGLTWSWEIMRASLRQLTEAERREALGATQSLFSAYGYLETELYAELRELPYRLPTSGGDRPSVDVPRQLRRLLNAFGPRVARTIVARFYYRVVQDPRISEQSRRFLYQSVQSVFPGGLFPLASPLGP